jgi:hypothetical protein
VRYLHYAPREEDARLVAEARSQWVHARVQRRTSETEECPARPFKNRGFAGRCPRGTREGQSQRRIADELRPAIEAIIDDLDRWLAPGANYVPPEPKD